MKIKLKNTNDAALFVQKCNEFESDIDLKFGRYTIDAKSIMGVLSTSLNKEYNVEIIATDIEEKKRFISEMQLWIA